VIAPPEVKIILSDFIRYPLAREKKILGRAIKCGIGRALRNMARLKAGLKFGVILVINSPGDEETKGKEGTYLSLRERYPFIERIIFRGNAGFDFGAYNEGYRYLKGAGYNGDVVFMNSSASGPKRPCAGAKNITDQKQKIRADQMYAGLLPKNGGGQP